MIPKIIHCCWLGGGPKTNLARTCRTSWERFLTQGRRDAEDGTCGEAWRICEWDDGKVQAELKDLPGYAFYEAAIAAGKWAMASDWVRMAVLWKEGGVYLDCDVELVGDLASICVEGEWVSSEWTATSGATWLNPGSGIALEKGSSLAGAMLEVYGKTRFDEGREMMPFVNAKLNEIFACGKLRVLPPEVMSPIDCSGRLHRTDATVGIHHYAMSWVPWWRRALKWISWHGGRPLVDALLNLRHHCAPGSTRCDAFVGEASSPPQMNENTQVTIGHRKFLFVWTGVTSYMADCWRALTARPGVELKIIVENVASGRGFDAEKVFAGLDCKVIDEGDVVAARSFVGDWTPDVIFAVGWHSKVVRAVVTDRAWRSVPKVCCFDLPWDGSFRRIAARWVLRPFLRHYAAAYVPGEACAKYARWLGFRKIERGLFAIDVKKFERGRDCPNRVGQGEGFLYLGRFSEEKRIDILLKAYGRYRELGGKWRFDLYGRGSGRGSGDSLSNDAAGAPRPRSDDVSFHPFVQPDEVPALYASHGCLVLASDFDPWPLVVLQACACGRPVIASDRCMNRLELMKENALVCPAGDVEAFAAAMLRAERGELDGESGRSLARPYDCREWAERTEVMS